MNERLIENWLDKANERAFQVPFCHSLAAQGFRVVHMSRHCALEMGKDILAIAPDGVPCAYQVKRVGGRKLGLSQYRADLEKQITSLALGAIDHPSIVSTKRHRAFIVLNGELEEEVSRSIQDFNRMHPRNCIGTILRGDLLSAFKNLQTDFWPVEVADTKSLLEMFFLSGRASVPKEKLTELFEDILPLAMKEGRKPSRQECSRAVAACAIFCSLAISGFTNADNHAAEFEAWTMFFSYVLGLAEKWRLPESCFASELHVASISMFNALARLFEEVRNRSHLFEGNPLVDEYVVSARTTYLLGLMGIYGLWMRMQGLQNDDEDLLRRFFKEESKQTWVWGEYAVPQILSAHFYRQKIDPSSASEALLYKCADAMVRLGKPESQGILASPYYEAEEILPHLMGVNDEPLEDRFDGHSFGLESVLQLLVRANLKQHVKVLWPEYSKIWTSSYEPKYRHDFYLWRSSEGVNKDVEQQSQQEWSVLRALAFESEGKSLPKLIRHYPVHLLAILTVFPHRLTSDVVRWLATALDSF